MAGIKITLMPWAQQRATDAMLNRGLIAPGEVWEGPDFNTGAASLNIYDKFVQVQHWNEKVARDMGKGPSVTYFYPIEDIARIKVDHEDAPELSVVK